MRRGKKRIKKKWRLFLRMTLTPGSFSISAFLDRSCKGRRLQRGPLGDLSAWRLGFRMLRARLLEDSDRPRTAIARRGFTEK